LTAELWQFAALIGGFFVVAVLWLCIIYLPARTMEYSEARRSEARDGDRGGDHESRRGSERPRFSLDGSKDSSERASGMSGRRELWALRTGALSDSNAVVTRTSCRRRVTG
jgi:hypothetical protein